MVPDSPATSQGATGLAVIFLHIGKTGGSTLRKIIDRNFRRSEVVLLQTPQRQDTLRPRREDSLQHLAEVSPDRLRLARLIEDHMIFGGRAFPPGPSTYITFI